MTNETAASNLSYDETQYLIQYHYMNTTATCILTVKSKQKSTKGHPQM